MAVIIYLIFYFKNDIRLISFGLDACLGGLPVCA